MHITDICWIKSSLMSHCNMILPVLKQWEAHNFKRNRMTLFILFYSFVKVHVPKAENIVIIRKLLLYNTNHFDLL